MGCTLIVIPMNTKTISEVVLGLNMAMSRKHYIRIARILKEMKNEEVKQATFRRMVEFMQNDNPRFDQMRFYRAVFED